MVAGDYDAPLRSELPGSRLTSAELMMIRPKYRSPLLRSPVFRLIYLSGKSNIGIYERKDWAGGSKLISSMNGKQVMFASVVGPVAVAGDLLGFFQHSRSRSHAIDHVDFRPILQVIGSFI